MTKVKKTEIGGDVPTNGAEEILKVGNPYVVEVEIQGTTDLLFHRWNCEGVEEKSRAAKGSKAKKMDDLETYVYRDEDGNLAVPGEYFRMAIIEAAKSKQDPRSPKKSAKDLYKAAIVPLTLYASLGTTSWDFEHKCRAVIQRNGITRTRPAMKKGWRATLQMQVLLPEYIQADELSDLITMAGKLVGLGDFRPTYGRFQIVCFKKIT